MWGAVGKISFFWVNLSKTTNTICFCWGVNEIKCLVKFATLFDFGFCCFFCLFFFCMVGNFWRTFIHKVKSKTVFSCVFFCFNTSKAPTLVYSWLLFVFYSYTRLDCDTAKHQKEPKEKFSKFNKVDWNSRMFYLSSLLLQVAMPPKWLLKKGRWWWKDLWFRACVKCKTSQNSQVRTFGHVGRCVLSFLELW